MKAIDAMFLWTPAIDPVQPENETAGQVKVVPNDAAADDPRYQRSGGACNKDWEEGDESHRLKEMQRLIDIMLADGVKRSTINAALAKVQEFRGHPFIFRVAEAAR